MQTSAWVLQLRVGVEMLPTLLMSCMCQMCSAPFGALPVAELPELTCLCDNVTMPCCKQLTQCRAELEGLTNEIKELEHKLQDKTAKLLKVKAELKSTIWDMKAMCVG